MPAYFLIACSLVFLRNAGSTGRFKDENKLGRDKGAIPMISRNLANKRSSDPKNQSHARHNNHPISNQSATKQHHATPY